MLKAHVLHRRTLACPLCRSTEFSTRRRVPSATPRHVTNLCTCRRCGGEFSYDEDKTGRPTVTISTG